jgi:uncharacterized delta-60 repeat protein/uncharacterized repeat protein (TIGR01451 family)
MLNSLAPKSTSRFRNRRPGLFRSLIIMIAIAAIGIAVLHPRLTRTVHAAGDVSLNTIGTAVAQNFDTLATTGTTNPWSDGTTLTGWYSQFDLSNPTTYIGDPGTSTTGAIHSYGVAGTNAVTERALGSIASGGTNTVYNAVKLTNNTGTTITGLLISYNGEQWRDGGNATLATQKLDFQYQVANAGTITDANTPTGGWTDYDPLDFTGPKATATAGALDGNAAANRTAKSALMPIGNVANGQEIWLRWKDINDTGNDHGLAVDDFSVTPLGGSISANGIRTTDIQGTDDGGFAMVLQPDGKTVVGGYAVDPVNGDKEFALVRYNYNGTLDTTFNATGKVVTDFNGTSDRIWGLALQSDGKIIAVGETVKPVALDNDVAIARYTTAGVLDTTFGGTGKVTTDYLAGNNSAYAVAMSGTSIIVVGAATVSGNLDFMVSKYTSVGVLDPTFNTLGAVPGINTVGFSGFNDVARAVVVPIAGTIVLGGYARSGGGDDDFAIARFTAAGALDTTFAGGTGKAALDLASGAPGSADQAFAMGLNPVTNSITLAGSTFNTGTGNKDFAVIRYLSTGALDLAGFGSGTGIVRTDFNNSPDVAQAVYVRPDGFTTVGGFARFSISSDDFAIARYTATGVLDPTLNGTGKLTTALSNADERIYGIAEEFDGKIVAAGFAAVAGSNPVTRNFAIARFSSAGVLDATNATQLNQPDLLTTKTGPTDPNSVIVGQNFTYTITVENRGLAAASNVIITDALPAAVTYVSHSASNGSSNQSAGTVTNNVGVLNAGATATLTITVTASNTPQLVSNTASATLTEADATPGNNTATEFTRIIGLIDMSFSPSTVTGGCQNSTGTVTLTGAAPTGGATVTLQSADPAAASAPPSVVVPQGQTSATFPVTTAPVVSNKQVRFQADLGPTTFVRRINVNAGVCNVGP